MHLPDVLCCPFPGGVLVLEMVDILGLDVRNVGEIEDDCQNDDDDRHRRIGDPKRLSARALARRVLAVKEQATGDWTKNPADAIAGLGEIDAGGRIAFVPQHRGVGIGHRLQEGQSGGDETDAEQERPELRDVRRRDEPEATHRDHQQAGDDAALVAEFGRQPSRRQRHEEVAQIVRKLHPGRLRQIKMQFLLKMLVHHVDHPIAESPEEKQRADEGEGEDEVSPVLHDEEAFLVGTHGV